MVPPPQIRVLRCCSCRLFQAHQVGLVPAYPSSWLQNQASRRLAQALPPELGCRLVRLRAVPGARTNDDDGPADCVSLASTSP